MTRYEIAQDLIPTVEIKTYGFSPSPELLNSRASVTYDITPQQSKALLNHMNMWHSEMVRNSLVMQPPMLMRVDPV